MSWTPFLSKTKDLPPSSLLVEALIYVKGRNNALDLGCGAGRDTVYLMDQGFTVTAVDNNPDVEQYLSALPHQEHLHFVCSTFESLSFQKYDLINARYALPFNPPLTFNQIFSTIKNSLEPSGVFVGQFFGKNDEWNTSTSSMSFHSKQEVEGLLSDLQVHKFEEEELDGKTANGQPKHWHVFHVIAQRP